MRKFKKINKKFIPKVFTVKELIKIREEEKRLLRDGKREWIN